MIKVAIAGASGYAGQQLVRLLSRHPQVQIAALYVSAGSADKGKRISDLYGAVYGQCDLPLLPLERPEEVAASGIDAVFLAIDHKSAHDLAPYFLQQEVAVFDLSGAYRVPEPEFYSKYYGFTHEHTDLLNEALYALCEHCSREDLQKHLLFSMPGCYPTASELVLKPLVKAGLIDTSLRPVINAVSGVSGAGRKASLTSSFCEVSLNPYGLFTHRHTPEISYHSGTPVIFNAHLGPFKSGILATITAKLAAGHSKDEPLAVLKKCYEHSALVRVKDTMPALKDVQGLPFCDISAVCDGEYIVAVSAIDNTLKGAAAQAVQAMNLHFGFAETQSLI